MKTYEGIDFSKCDLSGLTRNGERLKIICDAPCLRLSIAGPNGSVANRRIDVAWIPSLGILTASDLDDATNLREAIRRVDAFIEAERERMARESLNRRNDLSKPLVKIPEGSYWDNVSPAGIFAANKFFQSPTNAKELNCAIAALADGALRLRPEYSSVTVSLHGDKVASLDFVVDLEAI